MGLSITECTAAWHLRILVEQLRAPCETYMTRSLKSLKRSIAPTTKHPQARNPNGTRLRALCCVRSVGGRNSASPGAAKAAGTGALHGARAGRPRKRYNVR